MDGAPKLPRPSLPPGTHLLDRLNVLYKYRRIAVSVFLLILLGSLLRTYTTTPLYRAQARIIIEMEDEQTQVLAGAINAGGPRQWQDPKVYYQTQSSILTSREVARRAVQRLNLGRVTEFDGGGPAPTQLKRTLSSLIDTVTAPFRRLFGTTATTPETAPSERPEAVLIDLFLSRVGVTPVPNSRLVDVEFVGAAPAFAALAANTLAEEYVQHNLEIRRLNIVASLEWLSRELVKQQQAVEASERALAQYREDQNALSLEQRQNIVVARLNQLNDAVTRAKMNRVQKESAYERIRTLDADVSADTIPAILQNAYIQAMKTRLAELQREKAILLERYGPKYPEVLKVNASIQDAAAQLQTELAKQIEAIKNDYQSAVAEERTLAAALEDQKAVAMDLDRKSVSYTVLEREAQSNRQVYQTLLQREKELQVVANSQGNNVRLTDRAEVPGGPFIPTPRRDLMLAIMAGLALSLGLVYLLDYLDDTVKTPDDVTAKLNLPLLGVAPKVAGKLQPLLSRQVQQEFGEAFRSLRTSLVFSGGAGSPRIVMVTSAQALEGKTTTACNLSLALAIAGARVLLIDADMRRPGVHRTLDIANGTGLSHVLTGQASVEDAMVTLENPSLRVLTAGVPPPNPSELLGADAMRALIARVKRGGFDWVVIDTPPVLPVTDSVVLSPLVDGVAFVIGSEMTQRQHAARAAETLTDAGARVYGAVLNMVDLRRNRYYYSRYYGYKNKNYYFTPPAA